MILWSMLAVWSYETCLWILILGCIMNGFFLCIGIQFLAYYLVIRHCYVFGKILLYKIQSWVYHGFKIIILCLLNWFVMDAKLTLINMDTLLNSSCKKKNLGSNLYVDAIVKMLKFKPRNNHLYWLFDSWENFPR